MDRPPPRQPRDPFPPRRDPRRRPQPQPKHASPSPQGKSQRQRRPSIGVRRVEGTHPGYDLMHPPASYDVMPDYREGLELLREGDVDGARDALRFALEAARDSLWIHAALGRIALEQDRDLDLAEGHFGYVLDLVERGLPPNFSGPLPPERPANQPFYDALDGMIACYRLRGQTQRAEQLQRLADKWRPPTRNEGTPPIPSASASSSSP